MKQTRAYVLKDGSVVSEQEAFKAVFKESKQLPPDIFLGDYGVTSIIRPLYSVEYLARLMEENTYHQRAVKVVARDALGKGWSLQPRRGRKDADEAVRNEIEMKLDEIDATEGFQETLVRAGEDYKATGNAYLELTNSDEHLFELVHIPAHTMRRHSDQIRYVQHRGARRAWFKCIGYDQYEVNYKTGEIHKIKGDLTEREKFYGYMQGPIKDRSLVASEVIHIANYNIRSDYYGTPDVIPAIYAILGDKYRAEYNIDFFENHAMPAYAVTVTGADLDEDTIAQIKGFFNNDLKENRHSTIVLSASKDPNSPDATPIEFKFQALTPDTREASFENYRKDNRDEILSAHGVPPYRLGIAETGALGGSTAAESTEIYKDSVIKPFQKAFADEINRYIIWRIFEAYDWEFVFESLDTEDKTQTLDQLIKLVGVGALSPNELREKMGLERIDNPDLDQYFVGDKSLSSIVNPAPEQPTDNILNGLVPTKAVKALSDDIRTMIEITEAGKVDDYE